ncbi:hypothetical protein HDV00_001143 [Rhizophlyctis rosea]|nr:hypothetical protein HDV00_001143 [Rhizophlyctis rosea]
MSYAQKHGYHFQLIRHSLVIDRKPQWSKMLAAKQFLKDGFDWIWLLDLDAVITNHNIPLQNLIPPDVWYSTLHGYCDRSYLDPTRTGAIVAMDCNGLNSGSMLLRSDPWTFSYLDDAYKFGEDTAPSIWNDQRGFHEAYNAETHRNHFLILSQSQLNAYERECVGATSLPWRHGDFVIHFAGNPHLKSYYMMKYLRRRVGVLNDAVDDAKWDWMESLKGGLSVGEGKADLEVGRSG